MHTVRLDIDDSIYNKLMGLLDILPKDKLHIVEDEDFPAISFEEAQHKIRKSINNIEKNEGLSLDDAFDKVLHS